METLYTIVTPWPFFCGGFQFLSFLFHDSVVTVELWLRHRLRRHGRPFSATLATAVCGLSAV